MRQDEPLLATTFHAAAVTRPGWARYMEGVGAFALHSPFDAVVQGEELGLAVKAAWDGPQRSNPKVEWSLIRLEQPRGEAAAGEDRQGPARRAGCAGSAGL